MLPGSLKPLLLDHLKPVKKLHEEDVRRGHGRVFLPYALSRKYPQADLEWGWQWVFPAPDFSVDPRSGIRRRHHPPRQKSAEGLPWREGSAKPNGLALTPYRTPARVICTHTPPLPSDLRSIGADAYRLSRRIKAAAFSMRPRS